MKNTAKPSIPDLLTQPENQKNQLGIIALLSFLVMSPALINGFTYWDDHLYVSENPNIRSLSNIPGFFSEYLI